MSKQQVFFVASSHWDREWHQPFQYFRYRLVAMLDEVLDAMASDTGLSHFTMDGQSVPIEDYLEIRPERRDEICERVRSGRLAVGPWYAQPDLWMPSGESLLRNLQEGIRVAESLGAALRVGFLPDMFGHNGQMPQILRGFDMPCAFVWRGTSDETAAPGFIWQGADGTEIPAYRFGPHLGYGDYSLKVRRGMDHEGKPPADLDDFVARAAQWLEAQAERMAPLPVLFFDGVDHTFIEPRTPQIIERLQQGPLGERFDFHIATLGEYAEAFAAAADRIDKRIEGELREYNRGQSGRYSGSQPLIPGTLNSRVHLKQANSRCEALLTQWAEPWSLIAGRAGLEFPHGFLRAAWRHLLVNHAHDSICACSIDQVHRDMMYRFDQARLIATRLRDDALQWIADGVDRTTRADRSPEDRTQTLVLFNPTETDIDEPVDFSVLLPRNTPFFQEFFGYERKPGFRLRRPDGSELPYQRLAQEENVRGSLPLRREAPRQTLDWCVDVTARVCIPAWGYTTLTVEPVEGPTRCPQVGLSTGPVSMENEHLTVAVEPGGTLTVIDKRSGTRYEGLLAMEDCADIGDGWYHGVAVADEIFHSSALAASVARVADGPERCTLRIELDWPLPEFFDFDAMRRGDARRSLHIVHDVTLRRGGERIEVSTRVDNTIRNHRLRVLFPSGAREARSYLSDSQFDAVRRPIALDPESHTWRELEVETRPQQSWSAVWAGDRGLAVVSQGLIEAAVRDLPDRPIALSLLRAFQKTVRTKGEPGGQIQGEHRFDYWIVPLREAPNAAALGRLGRRLAGGVEARRPLPSAPPDELHEHRLRRGADPAPHLPLELAGPRIEGDVVVSALKETSDGATLIRLFNPGDDEVPCRIDMHDPIRSAHRCKLDDTPAGAVESDGSALDLDLRPHEIATLRIETD